LALGGPTAHFFCVKICVVDLRRRHRRSGHVFEGRYRCRVVENESYLWGVSRYDHLNPVPVLVEHPAQWPWSSYPGYRDQSLHLPWVAYDDLLEAWSGSFGAGKESYCDFVEQGLKQPSQVCLPELVDGWITGSDSFAKRIRKLVSPKSREPNVLRARNRPDLRIDDVFEAVCAEFRIPVTLLPQKSCRHPARSIAAIWPENTPQPPDWKSRRETGGHPDVETPFAVMLDRAQRCYSRSGANSCRALGCFPIISRPAPSCLG
jgi:hypothetical protein